MPTRLPGRLPGRTLGALARRIAAAAPALLLCALLAAVAAEATGGDWADALTNVGAALTVTAGLALPALAGGTAVGALFGLAAAVRPRSPAGWLGRMLGGVGPALPGFLLAALFATAGRGTAVAPGPAWVALAWVALAWTALAVPPAAQAARLARDALGRALDGEAALAARGRGLDGRTVLWRHAVPQALVPVTGALGMGSVAAVTGAVAVESLFGLPGAGALLVAAARQAEAGPAVAALAGLCALTILLKALGAVARGWFDPRFDPRFSGV